MSFGKYIFAGFVAALLPIALSARAQETGDGTLHVVRPVMHAEQEEAELCLEFDHDLDPASRMRVAAALKLESGGKTVPVKPQNVSIAGDLLCLPSLEHRREYRIVVGVARGAKGEKLASPYGLDFTIPDRPPSLGFIGNAGDEGIGRWQDDDPVLRAINVPYVHLELYRIADPALIAAGWRDRRQTTLAPSESATFGRDHGQMVWSGELTLGDTPNRTLEKAVPLKDFAAKASPGLYLIVARAPKKIDAETGDLPATGAAWLLRSGLRLRAVRDTGGLYGLTETTDAAAAQKNVRLMVADADAQPLAETRSDENGIGFVPLAADKIGKAAFLIGITGDGDVAFADLSDRAADHFNPPGNQATLALDKPFYATASQASATLTAHDAQGRAIAGTDTVLALTRPGGEIYTSFPVPAAADGTAHFAFSVPPVEGEWTLVWRRADGSVLAQISLRVTDNPAAPRIGMTADRSMISGDGNLNLTFKSLDAGGKPVPYVTGRVFAAWAVPDGVFREWKDFHFGDGASGPGESSPLASFVTDEKGAALVHLTLAPPDDHALLHDAVLSARGDTSTEMPAPLTIPLKPREGIVGIKPLLPGARFPENGLARFAVVMLDADGHRRGADDLSYQVYEEGRSFDWYQADGRWNFRPQQQKRRIGGGVLALQNTGDDIIEWPVGSGAYRLEITDADGNIRAAADFSAGWGSADVPPAPAPLILAPSSSAWQTGQDIQAHFKLDQPSMIDAFIGDDHIRKIIHRFAPAGDNMIAFTPEKDWGENIALRVETAIPDCAGQITFARAETTQESPKSAAPQQTAVNAPGLTIDGDFPTFLRVGDSVNMSVILGNTGKESETVHYVPSAAPGLKLVNPGGRSVTIPAGKQEKIPLSANAVRAGVSGIGLEISGPHLRASREWAVTVMTEDFGIEPVYSQKVEPQQTIIWPLRGKERAANDHILFLSPLPLYDAPVLLAGLLDAHPFTTGEIAGVLKTFFPWHRTIVAAGMMHETELAARERDLLTRLLARQKPDGGFAAIPGDGAADFASTSQALMALADIPLPPAKPAKELAAGWLRARLENNWFDESERPERAEAYAALAAADRLDAASLHYFSDTSAQKNLPPLVSAHMAFAFSRIGDQPASSFWIDKSGVMKNLTGIEAALLPPLAANVFFEPQNLSSAFEVLLAAPGKNTGSDIESAADRLRALWSIMDRRGAWRVTVDADRRNSQDIMVYPISEKAAIPVVTNSGYAPLFLAGVRKIAVSATASGNIVRHIYQLNGTEAAGRKPLGRDETYLVVLEGTWPDGTSPNAPVLAHDDAGPALPATGCMPPPPIETDDSLAWLKSQTLTPALACEISANGIDIWLTRKDNSAGAKWRAAYLATAKASGTYEVTPASVRGPKSGLANAAQTAEDRIEIR